MPTTYEPMFPKGSQPARSESQIGRNVMHNFIRDSISLPGWLALGGLLQTLLFLLPIKRHLAALPCMLYILFYTVDALLVTFNLRRNSMMEHVIQRKYGGFVPDAQGNFEYLNAHEKTADYSPAHRPMDDWDESNSFVVFMLGVRINHPLGFLSPGGRQIATFFPPMQADLEAHRERHGLLGMTGGLGSEKRTAGNEIATRLYFRSMRDLHDWAASPVHRAGLDWYEQNVKKYPYLAVMHEAYVVPKTNMETIYINWEPDGFAATKHIRKGEDGQPFFASPLVDISRGRMAGSRGRMSLPYWQ